MRRAACLAVILALGGCAAPSFHLFPAVPATPPAAPAAPVAVCSADLTAALDPRPPVPQGAFIPQPTDPTQKAGWDIFIQYLGNDYAGWAEEGWRRAALAKDWCAR